ncbi:MAG: hypothetical protein Q3M30_03290 [Candidatus Electrothrix sp. Rat3]|nr:hypothetical protein [Candidatus Electrothrix rattekaaiensis]
MKRAITFFCTLFISMLFLTNSHARSSGLLLGVNVFPVDTGLEVASTIPNTPAVGKLYPGDILRFMTTYGHPVYSVQHLSHLEKAKNAIGANRKTFLEILRNGNRMFFKVSFQQTTRAVAMRNGLGPSPSSSSRLSMTPVSQSDARRLFGNDVFSRK